MNILGMPEESTGHEITPSDSIKAYAKPKVLIAISTYNGAKWMEKQLDSIFSQIGIEIQVIVRDDGSSDGTEQVIANHPNRELITLYRGHNLGPSASFFQLMLLSRGFKFDYLGFSDQDDIWLPEKMIEGIKFLSVANAKVYASKRDSFVVQNEKIKIFKKSSNKIVPSLMNSFFENVFHGSTLILTKEYVEVLNAIIPLGMEVEYDNWIYSISCYHKVAAFDQRSFVLHRLHESNVSTYKKNLLLKLKMFDQNWKRKLSNMRFAIDLSVTEGKPLDVEIDLNVIISSSDSLKMIRALSIRRVRQKMIDDILLRVMLFLRNL